MSAYIQIICKYIVYRYLFEVSALISPVKVAATSVKLAIPLEKSKTQSIKELRRKKPVLHQ